MPPTLDISAAWRQPAVFAIKTARLRVAADEITDRFDRE
jgi:hypothetical protein